MEYFKNELSDIDAFIFDFDGVLTNNIVYLNQDGNEWVAWGRSDGLAFDVLRKLGKPAYILSTEINSVVKARGEKLNIPVLQGISNKVEALKELVDDKGYNLNKILYVGNEINDYKAMQLCGYAVCPADSHIKVKQISKVVLKTAGGQGIVRELLEDIFGIDFIEVLYGKY